MSGAEDASKTLVDPPLPESEWAPSVAGFAEASESAIPDAPAGQDVPTRPVFPGAAAEPRVSKTLPDPEPEVAPTRPEGPSTEERDKPRARGPRRAVRIGALRRDRGGSVRAPKTSQVRVWLVGAAAFVFGIGLTAAFFSLRSSRTERDDDGANDLVATSAAPRRIPPVVSPVAPLPPRIRPEARDQLVPGLIAPSAKPSVKNERVPPSTARRQTELEF